MNNEVDRRGISWFLALAFVPIIALSLILSSMQDSLANRIIIYNKLFFIAVMFFPGISALIVRKFINKECFKDPMMKFGSWKPYLQVSLFIPLLYIIIYVVTGLFYPPDFTLKTFMTLAGIEEMPFDTSSFILVLFIFTLVVAPIINFIPALGEEFGWRGYLLPKLLPLGREKALVISGIIWGLWHLPFVFLIGYKSYPDKIVGGLIFTALITLLGIYIGALALKNKSTLLASYMHGIFNAQDHGIWTIINPNYNHLIGGAEGLIGVIVLLPVALYYLRKTDSVLPSISPDY
jgi:membrane protease YdiL (CAAX protease family)